MSANPRLWLLLIGLFVVVANVVGFLVVPFLAYISRWLSYNMALPLIGLTAALLGAVFPLIAHASIRPDRDSGAKLSYLYLGNIVGSASGSFVVGFVFLNIWPLPRITLFLALLGVLFGSALLLSNVTKQRMPAAVAGCVCAVGMMMFLTGPAFSRVYDELCFKQGWFADSERHHFQRVVETRSGIVGVTPALLVYGNGSHEGQYVTDLRQTRFFNFTLPPFALGSFDPKFKNVLMVGLGSGSWAQIVANHPHLEKLTIIEINPGYVQLIPYYAQTASLLNNPKVQIVIDDGRRWLLRNSDRKFDALVINTPLHWRAHASSLLSVEFLQLARQHLNPGGVLFYNTTYSPRALLTGVSVFPYAVRVMGYLAVSDSPLVVDQEQWKNVLLQYKLDGQPVFDLQIPEDQALLKKVLSVANFHSATEWGGMDYADKIRSRYQGLALITDDNMGDEWLVP